MRPPSCDAHADVCVRVFVLGARRRRMRRVTSAVDRRQGRQEQVGWSGVVKVVCGMGRRARVVPSWAAALLPVLAASPSAVVRKHDA
jgi:hypothetical protein